MFKSIIAGAAAFALAVGLAPERAQADGDIARGVIFGAIIGGGIAAIASQSRKHYDDRRGVRRHHAAPRHGYTSRYGHAPRYRQQVIVPRHRRAVVPRGIFSTRDRGVSERRINRRVERRVERRLDRRAERRAEIRSDRRAERRGERRAERRAERRFERRQDRGVRAGRDDRNARVLAERRRHIRELRRTGQYPNGRADP